MSLAPVATDRPRSQARQLIERHARQIGRRAQQRHEQLREVFAISFLPGNHTISFLGRPRQQPIGTAPLVCLSYGRGEANGRRTMPIRGVQAAAHANGSVVYGEDGKGLFLHDAAMRPSGKSIHQPLNPARTRAHKALRVYEDYSELLDVPTWNPAREILPLELPNPADRILRQFQIHDLNQVISDQQLADLECAMRQAIGPSLPLEQFEVFDAIANHGAPVRAWSPVLSQLRSLLTAEVCQCTTNDDLLSAAKNPDKPLIASGACRIQVLKRHSSCDHVAFSLPPDDLGRRIEANLHVTTWRAAALARNCASS